LEFREHPLLNTPSLTALILHLTDQGPATIEALAARLDAVLAEAQERPDVSAGEIRDRIAALAEDLVAAQVLSRNGAAYALTARGRKALDDHPEGFARPDMMKYPEFAARVVDRLLHGSGDDPRPRAYDDGFAAQQSGEALEDNPFRPDTVDHLAWESGWSEAREQTSAAPPA
jgi:hypothetical protein